MRYSEKIDKAIEKAVILHRNQERLTPERIPYIAHIFSVYIQLSRYTKDEDVLIAGVLHDAVEDTDYSLDELEKDFGISVRHMVAGVTEPKFDVYGKKLPWKVRKVAYLEGLRHDSQESMTICVADKICNLRSLEADYHTYGDELWNMLTASFQDKMWYHTEVVKILEGRMHNQRAVADLKQTLEGTRRNILGLEEGKKSFMRRALYLPITGLYTLRLRGLSARIFGYGKRNTN